MNRGILQSLAGNTVTCSISGNSLVVGEAYTFGLHILDSATISEDTLSVFTDSITVVNVPTATALSASSSSLSSGQSFYFNVLISGGAGPFTVNLVESDGTVANSLASQSAGTVTLWTKAPVAGVLSFNIIATDTGTTHAYSFNSTTVSVTIPPASGIINSGGDSHSTTTVASTTTPVVSTSTVATTTAYTTLPAIQVVNASGSTAQIGIALSNSAPSEINFNNGQATLLIQSPESGTFNVTITNITSDSALPAFAGRERRLTLKINVTSTLPQKPTVNVLVAMRHDCSIPSGMIAPYLLLNGTWEPITPYSVNESACTESFNLLVDPVVALFELAPTTTTQVTTTVPQQAAPSSVPCLEIAIVVLLLLLVILYFLLKRRRKGKRSRRPQAH